MLGISYGELFLIIGATAALIGPKDLPIIARAAGRLAGKAIGYVQLARGQIQNVMEQSQATQVHKELKDTIAQLEAIRHEIRSISVINPSPLTRTFMENQEPASGSGGLSGESVHQNLDQARSPNRFVFKESNSTVSTAANLQSQAAAYARLAESLKNGSLESNGDAEKPDDEMGLLAILPVSAESAGLLPNHIDNANGSDIMLEAILEAEVAQNAKEFVVQHQDQIKHE